MIVLALLASGAAWASPASVRVAAIVDADLTTIRGTLDLTGCACTLIDPLPLLPAPADDRMRVRTFPGRDEVGAVTWEPVPGEPGRVRFEARLPVRYGTVGRLPGRGLWADGGWYPLPVDAAGHPVTARWDVELGLPADVVGVLNGEVGIREVRWRGYADRASIAVIAHGRVTEVPAGNGTLRFVEGGRVAKRLHGRVAALAAGVGWPLRSPPDLTIVEDLDLVHLASAAPGMVYLSARAFRLSPGLGRYHGPPIRRAMVEASVPRGVGWERSFVGGALTRGIPVPDMRKTLGFIAWNPLVDALLYDGTLPYYDAIFDEPFNANPGLFESAHPRFPAPAAARQLDDLRGEGTAITLSRLLLEGLPLEMAAAELEIPADVVAGWLGLYPTDQNYAVSVVDGRMEVVRTAPADAAAEVVVVTLDGVPAAPWVAGPGPDTLVVEGPGPVKRVRVDPHGHTRQADLVDDRWPSRWTTTFSGHLTNLSPTQKTFDLAGDFAFRRENDTHNLFLVAGEHHAQDLVGGALGYVRFFGPLLDRRLRPHRVTTLLGGSLLDPDFAATYPGTIALDASVAYAWDTRNGDVPLRGHRYSTALRVGMIPGDTEIWASALAGAVQLLPIDARQVVALRLGGGWASGDVPNRLLPLGGGDAVHGVPVGAVLGNERIVANVEYRAALFRNASIPLPLLWLTELQVSPGLEAGAAWRGEAVYAAVSATFGVHTVTDAFGARPVLAGVTLAQPLWTTGFLADRLQFYVDFAQSF
ncbi:MAG: hypothetical protein Q8P18_30005 [Pseudomonadota bacterium]|nr:hypothetical protein [Pseudomonadota bacterium]